MHIKFLFSLILIAFISCNNNALINGKYGCLRIRPNNSSDNKMLPILTMFSGDIKNYTAIMNQNNLTITYNDSNIYTNSLIMKSNKNYTSDNEYNVNFSGKSLFLINDSNDSLEFFKIKETY